MFLGVLVLTEVDGVNEFFGNFSVVEGVFERLADLDLNDVNVSLVFSLGPLNEVGYQLG